MSVPFKVKALFEYKSDYDDDLSFPAGLIITVTEIEDDEWYSGSYGGKAGMFPKNFVEKHAEVPAETEPPVKQTTTAPPEELEPEAEPEPEPKEEPVHALAKPIESAKPIEPETAALPPKRGHTIGVPVPKAPLPGLALQREDPYAIKKQFIGAGKSSYVPQVKPRDQSNVVHGFHDVAQDTEIVREHDHQPEEESNEPKMSLKERIALLQKRQQEEAEREAAALKRREERKKKAEEEKKKQKELQQSHTGSSLQNNATGSSIQKNVTGSSIQKNVTGSSIQRTATGQSLHSTEDAKPEAIDQPDVHDIPVEVAEEEEEVAEPIEVEAEGAEEEDEQEDEDEAEDADEDDDDEELKRRRLVERMAKISGGRNMFGMMGMPSPFGAPAPLKPKKAKQPQPEAEHEAEHEAVQEVPSAPSVPSRGIPLAGLAVPHEELKPAEDTEEVDDAEVDEDDSPTVTYSPPEKEDPELAEVRSIEKIPEPPAPEDYEAIEEPPTTPLKLSDSEPEEIKDSMTIVRKGANEEFTEYEADEDTSDRGAFATTEEENPSVPPIPTSVPVGPNHLKLPPPPPVPSSVPSNSFAANAPPPVPSAVPTSPHARAPPPPIPTSPPRSRAPPPVPTTPQQPSHPMELPSPNLPPPPPDLPPPGHELEDVQEDDTSDLGIESRAPFAVPEKAQTFSHPPPIPIPQVPQRTPTTSSIKRSSTESARRASNDGFGRTSVDGGQLGRSSSVRGRPEPVQADASLELLKLELSELESTSGWWIKNDIPDSLAAKLGTDLIFEVDTNKVYKRGGRQVVYKDYYILFHDLSQIVLELQYHADDPRATVIVIALAAKGAPQIRKDHLHKMSSSLGAIAADGAQKYLGAKISGGIVPEVFGQLLKNDPNVLEPIGEKAFGATIYKNNNANIVKIDEVRPGDILCAKGAKFASHKGLKGLGNKSIVLGEGNEMYAGVIVEYDPRKDKVKVLENDRSGIVKREGYRLDELKSGRVRIFRIVDRDYVGW